MSGVVSWIHIGDLHMTTADQQNYRDLNAIVDQINQRFQPGVQFVFLPGDVAEHGHPEEYVLVRSALDRLQLPWVSIIGDHDVHQRSFEPYHAAMVGAPFYSFDSGRYRFIALNAFQKPAPDSFLVDELQFGFLREMLAAAQQVQKQCVLFLHCYPSDLKQGYDTLRSIIEQYRPLLIEMGHTHYNEIANDGVALYATTRSPGQIEEGPVGFSITTLDEGVVSWKFKELADENPFVMITSVADGRLSTRPRRPAGIVRAKVWSAAPVRSVVVEPAGGQSRPMERIANTNLWQTVVDVAQAAGALRVTVEDEQGRTGHDIVDPTAKPAPPAGPRDQDHAIGEWRERSILGTQLGPNKNGRKW
jgi:Icc protein